MTDDLISKQRHPQKHPFVEPIEFHSLAGAFNVMAPLARQSPAKNCGNPNDPYTVRANRHEVHATN